MRFRISKKCMELVNPVNLPGAPLDSPKTGQMVLGKFFGKHYRARVLKNHV